MSQQLSAQDVEAALYAVTDFLARRMLNGTGAPIDVVLVERKLRAASDAGNGIRCSKEELEADTLIGPVEAAIILGCTPRRVRQIHTDLDGELVGNQWVFRRQTVAEYADAKGARDERSPVPRTRGPAIP